jgi:hypothetical protein
MPSERPQAERGSRGEVRRVSVFPPILKEELPREGPQPKARSSAWKKCLKLLHPAKARSPKPEAAQLAKAATPRDLAQHRPNVALR